jgi:uncharacterized protein
MIQLIAPEDYRSSAWKNGGGTATEIAAAHGADGAMAWRIGTAEITRDGPFSDYPGITRIFTVIRGPGVELDFPQGATHALSQDEPLSFAGAPAPFARLREGPATAFNLMVSEAFRGSVEVWAGAGAGQAVEPADLMAVMALDGSWRLDGSAGAATLAEGWTALVETAGEGLSAAGPAGGRAVIVRLIRR